MRGKRKYILLILFLFGFKRNEKIGVSYHGEILAKYDGNLFLTSKGFLLKISDKRIIDSLSKKNLPEIIGVDMSNEHDSFRMNSFLYPVSELLKRIKDTESKFYSEIKYVEPLKISIYTHNEKLIIFGLGRFDKKIRYLTEIEDFKDTLNLEILSFLERR
ncbi:MAG: hypothetical protein ABDH49_04295 [Candidatus Hydrothermales bacterium]